MAETLAALLAQLFFQLICISFSVDSLHSNVVELAKKIH